ncbi:MAG: hypothetical protein WHV66_10765 [Anaerolineales bacterium]|jgi:hypothetical protein
MNKRWIQAYKEAPWRVQVKRIAAFLSAMIAIAIVAGLYLNITAQTAAAGVEARKLEKQRDELMRQNSDLRAQLGFMSSRVEMERRARELGYEPVNPDQLKYMVIEGYPGRDSIRLASPPSPLQTSRPLLKPDYTQSLGEWLMNKMASLPGREGEE